MPHNGGWVKLYRQTFDNALFSENHDARHLFTDLLMMVAYEPRQMDWRGRPVDIERGQYMISLRSLSDRTGLPLQKLRTALTHCQHHGILKVNTVTNTGPMVITICNYCEFQDVPDQSTQSLTHSQHTANTPTNTQIKKKEIKKKENIDISGFDEFWDLYPRKVGKGQARKAWPKAVKAAGSSQTIIDSITTQRSGLAEKGDYCPHPGTWLNAERWTDQPSEGGDSASVMDGMTAREYQQLVLSRGR